MARADLAFRLIPGLIERCLIEFTPAAEHEPLPPFTSTIIFSHHRLKLDSSAVIDRMVDVLQRGQDTTGAWRDWAGDPELSIESTAMALHALALARPDRWERSAKKGRDWLWSRQQDDGAWREEAGDSLYLTVLVLDAINLADGERGKLTFKLSSESRTDAVAPSESDAGIEKSPRSVHSLKAAKACQEWMHANVLNQSQFAKRCGRSPKTIRKFFKTGEMRTSDFDDMADRLGVSAPQLLRGELPPPRPTRQ
jgi:hypothetical protein